MASPKLWCLTSGKGGVGKTSLAVNLAFALAYQGIRVLPVDGDLGPEEQELLAEVLWVIAAPCPPTRR